MNLADFLSPLPLVAVLRGISPPEVPGVADALTGAGFRVLEVTLNSPDPFDSLRALTARCGATCLVGAGTVIDPADVARVRDAGGRLIVMPHADVAVIREAKRLGLVCIPGVATPTEAFAALAAGADALKMFPAEALPPAALKAWRAGVAREHALPPYLVFHDAALAEMAQRCPATLEALADVSGVGAMKLDAYGEAILRVLRDAQR